MLTVTASHFLTLMVGEPVAYVQGFSPKGHRAVSCGVLTPRSPRDHVKSKRGRTASDFRGDGNAQRHPACSHWHVAPHRDGLWSGNGWRGSLAAGRCRVGSPLYRADSDSGRRKVRLRSAGRVPDRAGQFLAFAASHPHRQIETKAANDQDRGG